ncbi:MAG: hypothetical protein QN135_04315 [Armatimonadota bacterium]|nr:hypothetical protein [Armatimonadota bacterium]
MIGVRLAPGRVRVLAMLVAALLATPLLGAYAQEEIPVQVRAEYVRYDEARGLVYARGGVVITYQDVILRADEVLLDLNELELVARGNVVLEESGQVVTAEQLTYNFRTRFGSMDAAETRWRDPLVLDPIHIRAGRIEGNINQRICITNAEVSTCDLDDPQTPYKITADHVELIPQDKLVLRGASLHLFGWKVFTLPVIVIFLREPRQQRVFPVVGYNEAEGWFVKMTTTYFVNDSHYGFIYTDWMERIGFGAGVEHIWRYAEGDGNYFLYLLPNRQTGGTDHRARLQHRHNFGGGFAAGIFLDYFQRNFGGGRSASAFFGSLDAVYADAVQTANLFVSYGADDFGTEPNEAFAARLTYDRQILPGLRGRIDVPYSQLRIPDSPADQESTPRLDLVYFGPGYTLRLTAEHRFDLDGPAYAGDNFYSLSRLPEIVYSPFAQPLRLGDVSLLAQFNAGLGLFQEHNVPLTGGALGTVSAVRLDGQVIVAGTHRIADRTTTDVRLNGRLSYYSTGDLRGIFGGTVGVSHGFTDSLTARLTYNYQDNFGRTPFLFDRDVTRLHNVQFGLSYREATLAAELTGGYNFLAGRADALTLRVEWLPQPNWIVNFASSVDPNTWTVGSVEGSLRARLSEQWEVAYRAIYVPTTGTLLHDFVQATYYQDCWAASLTYLGSRQELWLEVWLTAFPRARGAVGLGQTGILFQQPFLPPGPLR